MLYNFDIQTGEYTGSAQAFRDPLADKPLVGNGQTEEAPPEAPEGHAVIRNTKENRWEILRDMRGFEYYPPGAVWGDKPAVIEKIGELPPEGYTKEPPVMPPAVRKEELYNTFMNVYSRITHTVSPPNLTAVYQLKAEAAAEIIAAEKRGEEYPEDAKVLLEAEAGTRGMSIDELAAQIVRIVKEAKNIAAVIENFRAKLKTELAEGNLTAAQKIINNTEALLASLPKN